MPKASCLPCLVALAVAVATIGGCSSSRLATPIPSLTGNWVFTTQPSLARTRSLTLTAGLSEHSDGTLAGTGHLSGSRCVSPTVPISFSGTVDAFGAITLTSKAFNGSVLSVKGIVAADGKSFSQVSFSFSGGNCSALGNVAALGTQYTQINGTYSGTFVDFANNQLPVTATLTQTTQPDANGQFHLSGSATFPNNPCFTDQPLITDSLVTGSNLSTTYVGNGGTITALGTFNSDATQLSITQWNVSGGLCDGDSGSGLLTLRNR